MKALYNGGALPALRELDLSYSSIGQAAIVDLLTYCRNLVNVNLNGCVYMHELSWGSSGLESATDMMIGPSLSDLLPLGNGNVSRRKSDHLLEFLNCTGCPYLRKVVIPSTASCFHLTKLNLNLSTNLKEVDLACPNLNSLNLRLATITLLFFFFCNLFCFILSNNLFFVFCKISKFSFFFPLFSYCSSLEILKLDCPRLTNLQLSVSALLHSLHCFCCSAIIIAF